MQSGSAARFCTLAVQARSAASVASNSAIPPSRIAASIAANQSTRSLIETITLDRTEGLPGPATISMLGNPAVPTPSCVSGPSVHFSRGITPRRLRIPGRNSAPVSVSNPVAKITMSSGWCRPPVRIPPASKAVIGSARMSTSDTFSRSNASK